ncbi:MAG: hypothetical protein ACREDL_14625 [Bradyrhizobium sp.]
MSYVAGVLSSARKSMSHRRDSAEPDYSKKIVLFGLAVRRMLVKVGGNGARNQIESTQ